LLTITSKLKELSKDNKKAKEDEFIEDVAIEFMSNIVTVCWFEEKNAVNAVDLKR
jgi:hypothetical protein